MGIYKEQLIRDEEDGTMDVDFEIHCAEMNHLMQEIREYQDSHFLIKYLKRFVYFINSKGINK